MLGIVICGNTLTLAGLPVTQVLGDDQHFTKEVRLGDIKGSGQSHTVSKM